jgi:hypothetical protein
MAPICTHLHPSTNGEKLREENNLRHLLVYIKPIYNISRDDREAYGAGKAH